MRRRSPRRTARRPWQTSIRNRDEKGVVRAQSEFLAREAEYREPLMKMATEDADPPVLYRVTDFASFLLNPIGGERRDVVVGVIGGLAPSDPTVASCGTVASPSITRPEARSNLAFTSEKRMATVA